MIHHYFTRQFLGFLVVGGISAFLNWLARAILSGWFSFSMAVVMAYAIGMTVAFLLNSAFIFPGAQKPRARQAIDFFAVNLAFLPVVWGGTLFFERTLRILGASANSQAIAHGMALLIPACATFLAYKFFAFKGSNYGR